MLLSSIFATTIFTIVSAQVNLNKTQLKEQTIEMFNHAYKSYMKYAYPADELMPLTCTGRVRGVTANRGDIDDALGNFSLTLIDALDTLAVLGDFDEFESATRRIVDEVRFDSDLVVSVFETNIRIVGGLLGGHAMALVIKREVEDSMVWYADQLLHLAKQVADRLLPAFETATGVPHPRINLKYGLDGPASCLRNQVETCTACAGTMLLEFAALSRLTGEPAYEQKARKAMDFIWRQRHSASDLVGTVLNVNTGDWIRRDSGVGAGIDSYYEYCLKAYVLLGDEDYLHRFNKHYSAVMKYVSQGPVMIDVHMHNPTVTSKTFMDSLLAFWPGLQVLKGDLKPAIEMHEVLYQVIQKHNFLPEAFTQDFQVHWGQHPLRPEFVESTYFLYKATKDEHYLQIGAEILETLNKHVRTDCGFAAVKDVRTMAMEDRMDSFVLAETFKYLFLLFSNRDDLLFDIDEYIFTTEAHLLPLHISSFSASNYVLPMPVYKQVPHMPLMYKEVYENEELSFEDSSTTCPNVNVLYDDGKSYALIFRNRMKNYVHRPVEYQQPAESSLIGGETQDLSFLGINVQTFDPTDSAQKQKLRLMGISVLTQPDGKMQLVHAAQKAVTPWLGEEGFKFMQAMIQSIGTNQDDIQHDRIVQLVSWPHFGRISLKAFAAQFGPKFDDSFPEIYGILLLAQPNSACTNLQSSVIGFKPSETILVANRGDCMFVQKTRNSEANGYAGVIIIDNTVIENATTSSPIFSMAGDGKDDVHIPSVFLYHNEGADLRKFMQKYEKVEVRIGRQTRNPADIFYVWLLRNSKQQNMRKLGKKNFLQCPPRKVEKKCKKRKKPDAWTTWLEGLIKLRQAHSTSTAAKSILDEKIGELLQTPGIADLIADGILKIEPPQRDEILGFFAEKNEEKMTENGNSTTIEIPTTSEP